MTLHSSPCNDLAELVIYWCVCVLSPVCVDIHTSRRAVAGHTPQCVYVHTEECTVDNNDWRGLEGAQLIIPSDWRGLEGAQLIIPSDWRGLEGAQLIIPSDWRDLEGFTGPTVIIMGA